MILSMGPALHAEGLKLKRTLALRMVFVAPALVALLGLSLQSAAVARGRGDLAATHWDSLTRSSLTVWAVFLMPFLITLETSLLCALEHGEKQWKHLFALPMPRYAIYTAKFVTAQALVLLSSVLMCLCLLLAGWVLILWHPTLAAAGLPPVWPVLSRSLQCWLAAGFVLSANLWIGLRWPSFAAPLGAGISGTFFALFAASAEASRYYPWLFPMNVLSGTDRATIALVLGCGGGLLMAVLGCVDFIRREESAPPKLSPVALAVWISILAGFLALAAYADRGRLSGSRIWHTVRFVPVDQDVKLEVIDWGGSGRPILLLSGLGDTAHVFHKFAAKLTGHYRVYGITRRGFGASSVPASGYSADRLGDDVLAVIDALKLQRPVLVGHSIGGEELSSVGSRHPEKVAGLVYLDAAYAYAYYDASRGDFNLALNDLTRKLERLRPGTDPADPKQLIQEIAGSLPGFERLLRERLKDLEAMRTEGATGQQPALVPLRRQPGLIAARSIMAGQQKYTKIHVPILAIYALPHDAGPNNAPFVARDISSITGPQADAVERSLTNARVVRLPNASHYIFQSNQADVLREMNAFISGLPRTDVPAAARTCLKLVDPGASGWA